MADPADLESVRRALAAARPDLMRSYDAVGTGIGRVGDRYCITVYLKTARDAPHRPVLVEGIEVNFVVTGGFRPHDPMARRAVTR